MFYAMRYIPTGINDNVVVRPVKVTPYKTLEGAVKALNSRGIGYVKQAGFNLPVYHNVPHSIEDFLKLGEYYANEQKNKIHRASRCTSNAK